MATATEVTWAVPVEYTWGKKGGGKGNGILGKVELPSESALEAVAESQYPLDLKLKLPSSSGLG